MAQRSMRTADSEGIGQVVNEAPWSRFPSPAAVIAGMGISTVAYAVLMLGTIATWIGTGQHQIAQMLYGLSVFGVTALAGCHFSAKIRPGTASLFGWASNCYPTGVFASGHGVPAGTSYSRT